MGLFDEISEVLSGMEKITGLPAADQQMIQEKSKALPVLLSGILNIWPQLKEKQTLSDNDLRALYEVLHTSSAGAIAPFNELLRGLDLSVNEDVLSPEELYQ